MNFLSHFYTELPVADSYFSAGVILPDILSNYSYRYGDIFKLHPAKIHAGNAPQTVSILNGVKQHYYIDSAFHPSAFFKENTQEIELLIHEKEMRCFPKRLFAFSHVFLELMLDRKILIENISVCDQLYALLGEVDLTILSDFLYANSEKKNVVNVVSHFEEFRKYKFIYDYAVDDRLCEILNRINGRLGNAPFTKNDKTLLTSLIHDYEISLLRKKFPKFPSHYEQYA